MRQSSSNDIFGEPRVPAGARCCHCERFVGQEAAVSVERGDYGTVYSVEFECPRCIEAGR